jgi:DNA-binding XRE family transcriptional regulator
MDEAADRLRQAREQRFGTKGEAADAIGVGRATYYGHENGFRGITPGMGRRYADFFGVRFEWLMTGRGPMRGERHPILDLCDAIPSDRQRQALEYLEFLRSRKP